MSYGIQVGAFSSEKQALKGLATARKRADGLLEGRTGVIEPLKRKRRAKLYRARLLSFDKSEAAFACRELKKRKIPCMSFRVKAN